jgi:hypothetical protein
VDAYGLDLEPQVLVDDYLGNYSDNKSFWDEGYAAILAIEGADDFTPHYHTTGDRLSTLNMAYYTEFVRAALATFLHLGNCLPAVPSGALHGHVTAAGAGGPLAGQPWGAALTSAGMLLAGQPRGAAPTANANMLRTGQPRGAAPTADPIPGAALTRRSAAGDAYSATADAAGYYTQTLPAGTYTVTASAAGYQTATVTGVGIWSGLATVQDFALQPLPVAQPTYLPQILRAKADAP